ncbi:MAG TPA: hypothetical protein IAD32_02950 [Candidatus Scatavimonas merdigallinarum]|uniref:MORN repeat protein n=1 Tax=Candidatus Scatavimonas merdigallinarum TaxID=2840914 RepID=A0A9D1CTZ7_9FIRM|nr:hypothetical protein [Candidatus Scatavimonas merdigallinarum]
MTVSIRPRISGDIMYYTAYLLSADPIRFGSDILLKVRKAYFTSGKRQKNKIFLNVQGEALQCFYTMENRRPLKWKKVSEGRLCERTAQTGPSGYCVETLDYSGTVIKKMYFNLHHQWLRTEYFDGFHSQPEFTLMPWPNAKQVGLALYTAERETPSVLQSVPLPQEQALLDQLVQEVLPEACAQTAQGLAYFCTEQKYTLWVQMLDKLGEKEEKSAARAQRTRKKAGAFYFDIQALADEQTTFDLTKAPYLSADGPAALQQDAALEKENKKTRAEKEKVLLQKQPAQTEEKRKRKKPQAPAIAGPDKVLPLSGKEKCFYYGALDENGARTGLGRTQTSQGKTLYDGTYKNDMRNGFGVYYFKTGRISYLGNWKDNKRDGFGIAFRPTDGSVHVGVFENDAPRGTAARFDKEGNLVYAGSWKDGVKTGAGITVAPNGALQISAWKDGKQQNTGALLDMYGAVYYSGGLKNGKKEGKGTLFAADGALVYTGMFKNDAFEGQGRLFLEDGGSIAGTFVNGKVNGKACKYTENGTLVYDGMWKDGLPNGDGALYAADGSKMQGSFIQGKAAGCFSCFSKDGRLCYKGTLADGLYDGQGVLYEEDKPVYDGAFACGEKCGMGRLFEDGACVYMGMFAHGLPNGYGQRFENGQRVYYGFFQNGLYHGHGMLFEDDRPKYAGSFSAGKMHGRINRVSDGHIIEECIYQQGKCIYMRSYTLDGALLYEGNIKDGMREGMGCAFTEFGEKSFEGIFKYNEPFKSMKVIVKKLEPLARCEKLKNTEYESCRTAPAFAVEEPVGGGIYSGMLGERGVPHGKGTMLYPDHRYTGFFEDGAPRGMGVIYFGDGRELRARFVKAPATGGARAVFSTVTYDYILEQSGKDGDAYVDRSNPAVY